MSAALNSSSFACACRFPRGYAKIIEHYSLMRFPDRRMQFYNAGKGGDTAQSSLQRLERDVLHVTHGDHRPVR